MEKEFYTISEVCAWTGFCQSTIYNLVQAGEFPPPRHILNRRLARWDRKSLLDWRDSILKGSRRLRVDAAPEQPEA